MRFHVSVIVVENQQQITVSFEQTYDYKAHNCPRVHFSKYKKFDFQIFGAKIQII